MIDLLIIVVGAVWMGFHIGWLVGESAGRKRTSAPMSESEPSGPPPVCDGCGQGFCPPGCQYYWEGRCEGCGRWDEDCPTPGPDCLYAAAVLEAHDFDPEP